ncbi:hypothetical protein [Exiguobacterium sp. s142]|uniref:hypothetical protein n=1 Tax=Exiguobacterium sp. s142 TaxID=2751222 RepID=UPI001BE4FAF4|nr:hypothetical protein [Exiguobacterium sp. s142]
MNFNAKTNWKIDDPISENDLNRWETGIDDSHKKSTEIAAQLADKATKTEVTTALYLKTDKTYTDSQLTLKRDKTEKIAGTELDTSTDGKKVKLINLADEVQQALTGNAPALSIITDGAIGTTKLADASLKRAKSGTSLGSLQDAIYLSNNECYLTRSGTDLLVKFKLYTTFNFKNVESVQFVSLNAAEDLEYTVPTGSALVHTLGTRNKLLVKSADTLTTSDFIMLVNNNGEVYGNNLEFKRQGFNNHMVYFGGTVVYDLTSGFTVTFSGDMRLFVRTGKGANYTFIVPQSSYSIATGNVLVYRAYTQTMTVKSVDSLLVDDVVLIGNVGNKPVQNNIGATATNTLANRQFADDIVMYGTFEGVYVESVSGNAVVTFGTEDPRLFYKTSEGNKQIVLTTFVYTVPSNFSLVLNKSSQVLEVVNSDSIIRGTHLLLLAVRYGKVIKSNLAHIEKPSPNKVFREMNKPAVSIKRFSFPLQQDGCVVEDEIWLFDESTPNHVGNSTIRVLDKATFAEKANKQHNLGHANGVDYRNGFLLVFNGATYPPEINIFKNPYGKTSVLTTDTANTQIIFMEGNKRLEGDGSACFGENERIVYYNAGAKIYKFLLGMGDNDLSDVTPGKTDPAYWGTFTSGKAQTEYNGTAKLLKTYTLTDQLTPGQVQPQGITYNGSLYLVTGSEYCHAFKVELLTNGTFNIIDDFKYSHTNYKNEIIHVEPQIAFTIDDKLYVGCRGDGDTFMVEMQT